MKRLGQELGGGVVVAAVFLLSGFTGCIATLDGTPHARPAHEQSVVEDEAPEMVVGSDATVVEGVDPALAAYAASTVEAPAPQSSEVPSIDDAPLESTLRVHEIGLSSLDGEQSITIHLSRSPDELVHFPLDGPSRVVVDLDGPMSGSSSLAKYEIGAGGIDRVRIGEHPAKLRVVADLSGAFSSNYSVEQSGRSVVVTVSGEGEPRSNETVFLAPGVLPATLRPTPQNEIVVSEVAEPVIDDRPSAGTDGDELGDFAPQPDAAALTAPSAPTVVAEYEPTQADDVAVAEVEPTVFDDAEADADEPVANDDEVVLAEASDSQPEIQVADIREIGTEAEDLSAIDHVYEISDEALAEAIEARMKEEALETATAEPDAAELPEPETAEPWTEPKTVAAAREPTYALPMQSGSRDEFTGQRISLDFKDADIQNVLRILADVSDLNIITTEDVDGRLTIRLVNVPWDQALDSILKAQGLDKVRDGNIVRISTVGRLKEERDAQRAADEAQKQAEPLRVRYIRVNYAKADEELVKKIQEVLTERGTATWDARTNTIVVRDIARGVASAEELITEFDTQTPQVLIEANIVEATETFARDLGVQWGYTYNASPEIGNSSGNNFPGRVGAGGILAGGENSPASVVPFIADFPAASVAPGAGAAYDLLLGSLDGSHSLNARLTALERQGKGKIISRPRVVTLNNVAAKIESLEILRVKLPSTGTVISTGAGGAAGSSQNATEQIRTGITLDVTPQVSSDGYIFLDVYAKSSTLQDPTQSRAPSPDGIPNEVSREAESHVLIKDGETFVLGGVFRNILDTNERGLPFLSQIPVIGWAFKNKLDIDQRQELLVFVTPRAVQARGAENLASLPSAESLWQNRENP